MRECVKYYICSTYPSRRTPARGFTNYTFAFLPLCLCISIFCCCWMQATHIGWNYKGHILNILVHIRVSGLRQYLMISISLNPPANAGDIRDAGFILGLGRSPGGRHGNPLQCSCLENPMDRGVWWVTVHGVTKNWTQLRWLSMHSFLFWWLYLIFSACFLFV